MSLLGESIDVVVSISLSFKVDKKNVRGAAFWSDHGSISVASV